MALSSVRTYYDVGLLFPLSCQSEAIAPVTIATQSTGSSYMATMMQSSGTNAPEPEYEHQLTQPVGKQRQMVLRRHSRLYAGVAFRCVVCGDNALGCASLLLAYRFSCIGDMWARHGNHVTRCRCREQLESGTRGGPS